MSIMADQILVQFIGDVRQLNTSLNQVNKNLEKTKTQATLTGQAINAAFVGAAIAGIAVGIKGAIDLESAMAKVNTMANLNKKQLGALSNQVLELSSSYGKAATEIADSLFDISSAGFKGVEAMQVLNASLELSVAGFSDIKTTNEAIVRTLKAYGRSARDAGTVSKTLFAAMKVGIVDMQQLASVFPRVAASAASIGVPLDEAAAAFARITQVFRPAEASTMIDRFFSRIATGSEKLEPVRQALIGPDGLAGAIEVLRSISGGGTQGLKALGFAENDLKAAVLLLAEFKDTLKSVRTGTGELSGALETAQQTAAQKLAVSLESLKNTLTDLGSKILPILNKGLSGLNTTTGTTIAGIGAFGISIVVAGKALSYIIGQLMLARNAVKHAEKVMATNKLLAGMGAENLKEMGFSTWTATWIKFTGTLKAIAVAAAKVVAVFGFFFTLSAFLTTALTDFEKLVRVYDLMADKLLKILGISQKTLKTNENFLIAQKNLNKAQQEYNDLTTKGNQLKMEEARLNKLVELQKYILNLITSRSKKEAESAGWLTKFLFNMEPSGLTDFERKQWINIRNRIDAQKQLNEKIRDEITLRNLLDKLVKDAAVFKERTAFETLTKSLKEDNDALDRFSVLFKDVIDLMPKMDEEAARISSRFDDLLKNLLDFREGLLGKDSPLLKQALIDTNKLIALTKQQKQIALDTLKARKFEPAGPTGGVAAMDISTIAGVSSFLSAKRAREDVETKKLEEKNLDANEKTEKNTRMIEKKLGEIKTGKIEIIKVSM